MPKYYYYLDDSDSPYPEIRKTTDLTFQTTGTFSEVKRDSIERYQGIIDHYKGIVKMLRALKKADIKE